MFYPFPHASHIDDYLPAIANREEFIVKRDEQSGIAVINYLFMTDSSFPDPLALANPAERTLAALRRECRGIKFDLHTGRVVARPYAKFFNVNERPECMANVIDWSRRHWLLIKLDGSMVTAHRRRDGVLEWHTKMGYTQVAEPVQRHVAASERPYAALVDHAREQDQTAIFEWCSRQNRIVIDYPCDALVLTAIRHNVTGEYLRYPDMVALAQTFGIPVVEAFSSGSGSIATVLDEIGALRDLEGVVVRFDDGSMCKIKAENYRQLHKFKETLGSEKLVWNLLLDNRLDDAKPFMQDADRHVIEAFAAEFYTRLQRTTARLVSKVAFDRQRFGDKKQFAQHGVITAPPQERGLLFRIWDGHDGWTELTNYLAKHINTQARVDAVRDLVDGLSWHQFFVTEEQ